MSFNDLHAEWLSLIEISGPFLAVPVLKEVFPQGLEQLDIDKRKRLRQAYEEWREALENDDPRFLELHQAWIAEVLGRGLELDEDGRGDVLKRGTSIPDKLIIDLPEYGVKLAPDAVVIDEQSGNALMLIQTFPVMTDLEANGKRDGWASSPAERIVQLCRQTGCRLGLLTNGERWMLVDAPVGAVTTFASWYARLWGQEPITLQAFVHLLGVRRFFVDDSERLPALFDRSLKHQDEVTDALGEQVRRAVEVLIQALGKADLDRDRTLLANVSTAEIYEAALTVMMRLVFLLSAEERGLLLLGDERYEAHYALSTLRMQLRADSPEILECRWDAWSRLLALFRAVYGGIEHENLRMPALGGSLFDPDRFPFLEGRDKHSQWRTDPAKPLPIDNRTVLLLLDAIQQFQGRTLSYRALDVEQIGYVYEGLLERTVKRAKDVTLELDATKNAKSPWVTLTELETARKAGDEKLAELLRERSGSSANRIRNDLAKAVDDVLSDKLLTACHADVALRDRVKPFANLLRFDPWGYPLVYPKDSFMVTTGSDRRETGTHYTPKSLTEAIVTETLTPVVYIGPAEGKPREEWQLKSAAELLDLKICDPAMGSGAFLVQVCRWLAERLVEAWIRAESAGKYVTVDGEVRDTVTDEEPLPRDDEERSVIARRLIAERCLYGVDLNPLAVELAKLSIWLVTLAKGRPFGFLDHNLRCGDSLLGIHRLDQLTELSMKPGQKNTQMRIFGRNIEQAVAEAIQLRKRLRQMPIRDIHDVEAMARLDAEAKAKLEAPELIADAFIGEVFRTGGNQNVLDVTLMTLSIEAQQYLQGDVNAKRNLRQRAGRGLSFELPEGKLLRKPLHWPMEFPEVFSSENAGFDAMVGNPPFLGNSSWKAVLGNEFKTYVSTLIGSLPGKVDLSVIFHRRSCELIRFRGCYGLVAANNMVEGSATSIGTEKLLESGEFIWTFRDLRWLGHASVIAAIICFFKGLFSGTRYANGKRCLRIGPKLVSDSEYNKWNPQRLKNCFYAFKGCDNSRGLAFVLNEDSNWFNVLKEEPFSLLRPYITGDDITSSALHQIGRWALDIGDKDIDYINSNYPLAFRFLNEIVKPNRSVSELKSYKGLSERWWQFWNHRAGQMCEIRKYPNFVAFSRVTKHPICMLANSDWIYTEGVILIQNSRPDVLAICQSSAFTEWMVRQQGAKFGVGATLRLSIRDGIETFPPPLKFVSNEGVEKSIFFNNIASEWTKANGVGLTQFYNALSDEKCISPIILDARKLLIQIDHAVCVAYGWDDINLERGFHCAPYLSESTAFVIPDSQRFELLERLLTLNRKYYEQENISKVEESPATKVKTSRVTLKVCEATKPLQTNLFDEHVDIDLLSSKKEIRGGNAWGANALDQILAWLEAHKGWFSKSAILNGCGADPEAWTDTINELLNDDYIETRGNASNATYRAKP